MGADQTVVRGTVRMADHPTPDPAGQRRRQKHPYDLSEYRINLSVDLSTTFNAAPGDPLPPGGPWVGVGAPNELQPQQYTYARLISYRIQHPDSPAWVEGTPTEAGTLAVSIHGIEHCQTATQIEQATTGLHIAFDIAAEQGIPTIREPHEWPRDRYLSMWREVRPQHRTRSEVVKAMASKTGVTERSIRRWPKLYGYPLYETVEEYDRQLDKFGQIADNDGAV